jgi:pyrroloquinoline quinone (PQQ) biosynthesis protein C
MAMSEKDSERSFYINWPALLARVDFFKKAIDYLEAEDCASEDLAAEAKKKIAEASELIIAATEDHDKEKQNKAEDLVNEVMHMFFAMLDNCYNKYAGPRMSQMSKSQG